MDTPRARSRRPALPPLSSNSERALPPPPPPLSAATSPFHDISFVFSSASASPSAGHLDSLSMSRAPVVCRVGSDLSHNSYSSKATIKTHGTGRKDDKAKVKNRTSSPLFTGQRVKKYMTFMVEKLRSVFYRPQQADTEQRRRRPHSFWGHGPNAAREMKDRGRWMRRRGQLSSAPASLRVSPANSGHLSVGGSVKVTTPSEESTMEELQSAIDAAIAHCKNSISRAQAQADELERTHEYMTKQSSSSIRA